MKKALMILSSLLVAVGAFAQGSVQFSGKVANVYDAPVFVGSVAGGVRATGPAYMVQLYAGNTATSLGPVAGSLLPFLTGAGAGYWKTTGVTIPAGSIDASGNSFLQVRAWATASGATYELASASGTGFGLSNTLTIKPTNAPDVPALLTGLTSFAISGAAPVLPEPSVMAVAALGGLALLLLRRK